MDISKNDLPVLLSEKVLNYFSLKDLIWHQEADFERSEAEESQNFMVLSKLGPRPWRVS